MYCSNCGTEIPSGSKFCPECGKNLQYRQDYDTPGIGTLSIARKSATMATMIKTRIYVDGELKNEVGDGKVVSFLLDEGEHEVTLQTPGNKGISKIITIYPDIETRFIFQLSLSAEGYHKIIGISEKYPEDIPEPPARSVPQVIEQPKPVDRKAKKGKRCPKCGGQMTIQMVTESRKSGCGTILLYILLALTILGLLIVIPLALRKKTETVTYAICQNCGYKRLISRS